MDRLNETRISVLQRMLWNPRKDIHPGLLHGYVQLCQVLSNEDIDIIRISLKRQGQARSNDTGRIGRCAYVPMMPENEVLSLAESLVRNFPGRKGYCGRLLYMLDAIYDPGTVSEVSRVFACYFHSRNIDYVITVETKGIPLAFMTAAYLNRPLLIARRNIEATDGASVNEVCFRLFGQDTDHGASDAVIEARFTVTFHR